ncbi:MAG: bifunctional proline dehydrogenase/L-glutamate gamma-semialdehyde dehydrogenase, partial [Verrucomicrobiota bacterium]
MTTTLRSKPPRSKDTDLGKPAVELAEQLLLESMKLEQPSERRSMHKLSRLMDDQEGKELTFHLTDQVFRPPLARRSAGLFRSLIRRHGIPRYLGTLDLLMMGLGALVSRIVPGLVMPAITRRLIEESREVILPAEQLSLDKHVTRRRSEGAAINLNLLGEAVLGEQEATQRLERNLEAIRSGTADYISIKLSSIFSQITLTAPEFSKQQLSDRLRLLYRAALKRSPHPFINLDMEEYRDLQLTLDVFRSVLSEPEFLGLRAGIVLQAYLPDTHPLQIELTRWARERVDRGGAPIKVRLVKGANLAMEKADAELHDWPQAPYPTKAEVDANYLRMLDFACRPENAKVVHVGVASHNLFNLAHAILLREQRGVGDLVEIEMLEGMAAPQARAVLPRAKSVLFYAPVVEKEDFNAAIAYLIRRLDENTTPGNFLHDLFNIQPGNEAWKRQRDAFLKALADSAQVDSSPRRCQNRQTQRNSLASGTFRNTPDTDFSLPANQKWLDQALKHPPRDLDSGPAPTIEDIERVIATAATSSWPDTKLDERASLIKRAALELEHSRADLIAEMNREGNKAPAEADVEVSEAVDFANYYSHSFRGNAWDDGLDHEPIGPVVITPPWNFPCAIPCGGILAALMAGNPVIIKPAPETVRIARLMTECLWRAGIPRDALQFTTAPDNEVGQRLVADPRI